MKEAWVKVYGIICSVMQPAMQDEISKKKKLESDKAKKRTIRAAGILAGVAVVSSLVMKRK
eukprot:3851392-Pyramimonas_sp.AAC.2